MSDYSDDSDDLDDIPLSLPRTNNRYGDDPPPTSRGPPTTSFAKLPLGFKLNLPPPAPMESDLTEMRSEPPESTQTNKPRMSISLGTPRTAPLIMPVKEAHTPDLPPATSRGPKPPRLMLANPASATPVGSPGPTSSILRPSGLGSLSDASRPSTSERITVELISTAFTLHSMPTENNTASVIRQRCSSSLGVQFEDLELFEIRPLEDVHIPADCRHVGVMVNRSTFSLSALEDMVSQSRQSAQLANMLEASQKNCQNSAAEATKQSVRAAQQDAENALLREKLRNLEQEKEQLRHEKDQLRDKLSHSDEQRRKLAGTITHLKKEFEELRSKCEREQSNSELATVMQGLKMGASGAASSVQLQSQQNTPTA